MMKTSRNKEADRIWREYCSKFRLNENISSVMDAYRTRPSTAKLEAEKRILKEMQELNGYGYIIMSASNWFFSCAYAVETTAGTMLIYHTKGNRREILFDGQYKYWRA